MKIKYILTVILLTSVFFASCNDDDKGSGGSSGGEIEIPEVLPEGDFATEAQSLTIAPYLHYMTVSWAEPTDTKGLNGYLVEWKGSTTDKALYSTIVDKTKKTLNITKLHNEQYTVTVKCVSTDMLYSTGISGTGTPVADNTAPAIVSNLKVEPVATSALATWTNPADDDLEGLFINVETITGDSVIFSGIVPPELTKFQIIGLEELTEYKISVKAIDYIGNTSVVVDKTFKTMTEVPFFNDQAIKWELIDCSSQEIDATAAMAIDNNSSTFWHSKWTGGGTLLPQFIIFDIKQELIPTALISFKRDGNPNGPTLVQVEGCLDIHNPEWLDFGTFTLSKDINTGQLCNLIAPKKVRYIRYTVRASGNGKHAMVREIQFRALVNQ